MRDYPLAACYLEYTGIEKVRDRKMKKNNKPPTIEEVIEAFEEKDAKLLSDTYVNTHTKMEFLCNKHNDFGVQYTTFYAVKRNEYICKECIKLNRFGKKHEVPSRIENHYDELFKKYEDKLKEENDGSEYVLNKIYSYNGKTMLDLIHLECNEHYHVEQNKFFKSHNRCQNPDCKFKRMSSRSIRTHDSIIKQIHDLIKDEYSVLSEYKGSNNDMKFKHNICNHEFSMTPHNFIFGGQRCPKCAWSIRIEKMTKPHEEFIKELECKYPNEYEVLDKYANSNTKIRFLHKSCNHITWQTPYRALNNLSICKFCDYPTRGEQKIIDCLDAIMFGEYEYQKSYDDLLGINNGELSYDFYIPKYNLLIEYQGEYHDGSVSCQTEEEFEIQKEHDRRKKEYAKAHNIDLLEIWYWDFNNIENILTDYLNLYNENVS